MRKILAALVLVMALAGTARANDFTMYVEEVYLENETQFRFKMHSGFNSDGSAAGINANWFVVNVATVGATMFDRIHAQLLTALVNKRKCWVGTNGTTFNVLQTTVYYR